MGWQWHQLDHMQIICTSLQTDNHASTSSVNFLQAWHSINIVKALKAVWERLPFWSSGSHYSHFLTENETENASFFDASIFNPIFESENGKLSHNVKPYLRYISTGIWFYYVSKQHGATTFYHIIFCNHSNGVFTAKKLWLKLVNR